MIAATWGFGLGGIPDLTPLHLSPKLRHPPMISTLELTHFRGLEHVRFENLGRANLIIGGNNTGKTSLLEGLVLLYGVDGQLKSLPGLFRETVGESVDQFKNYWRFLVREQNINAFQISSGMRTIAVSVVPFQSEREGTQWKFFERDSKSNGSYGKPKVIFEEEEDVGFNRKQSPQKLSILSTKQADPAVVSELFNQIAPLNPENEAKLEDLLRRSIEPRLRRLRYAKPQGTSTHLVYADLGKGPMLPFTQLGQAFSRTLQVYCAIFAERPDILLVDEIENGLYYEGLEDYWRGLMTVLKDQNVQLFATTHSRECMEAASRAAASEEGDPLRYLRLDRRVDDAEKIVATTFGREEMSTAIEFNREMR